MQIAPLLAAQIAPTPSGAPAPAGLRPGQVLQATVLGSAPGGATRVAVGSEVLALSLTGRPQPGSALQLQVLGSGAGARLQVLAPPPASGAPQGPATVLGLPAGPVRAAAAEAAQAAAGRQDSMAQLFAGLARAGGSSGLPGAVAPAAAGTLAAVLNLNAGPLTAGALQNAFQRSGLFYEAALARGAPAQAVAGDLKGALLSLSAALSAWLGRETAGPPQRGARPPPPTRGALPQAQRAPVSTAVAPVSREDAGRALLAETEAALARLRLAQLASLPEPRAPASQGQAVPAEWTFEVPFALGGETGIAQFRIDRDGGSEGRDGESPRTWQMRLSIDFAETGGVHARVTLSGGRVGVQLWAEREETARALGEALPELGPALESLGLSVGDIRCRQGAPEAPGAAAGALMDQRT